MKKRYKYCTPSQLIRIKREALAIMGPELTNMEVADQLIIHCIDAKGYKRNRRALASIVGYMRKQLNPKVECEEEKESNMPFIIVALVVAAFFAWFIYDQVFQ